jgi:hypothetical protein
MPITINGAGSLTGITAGGLPDASIVTADIADANITAAKLSGAQTGSAPIYGCRAWVNFSGTGSTGFNQSINGSGNVSSVFKTGVGEYKINFTTPMQDANYCYTCSATSDSLQNTGLIVVSASYSVLNNAVSTGFIEIISSRNGSRIDATSITVAIFR